MDTSSSPMQHAPRRGHLKRLSLSVGSSSGSPARDTLTSSSSSPPMSTPDKHLSASSSSLHSSGGSAASSKRDSLSPLHRSLGGTGRRQRPMSMHAGMSSPLSTSLASLDASLSSPAGPAIFPANQQRPDHVVTEDQQQVTSADSVAHPLSSNTNTISSTSTPLHDDTASPGSSEASPSPSSSANLRSSAGRRSILGRSAHARRQSSISYARSPSYDSPVGTPRTSLTAIRDEDEAECEDAGNAAPAAATAKPSPSPVNDAQTPTRTSLDHQSLDMSSSSEAGTHQTLSGTSPLSVNEMNIGPGARSTDLLTFIAKKERKCLDLREELQRHEAELAALKKKWEIVIQREMAVSTSPSSTNMSPSQSLGSAGGAASLFSSLTSTLNGSSSSLSSSTSSQPAAGDGISSPSPKPGTGSSRRLLTSRHSISFASPSTSAPYFGGGADLSPQTSPLSALNGSQPVASLDVQKIAKSWLGGVMKSASTVLEGLAPPPPSQNDLQTVAEEEEPEEGEEDNRFNTNHQRSSAGHPSGGRSPHLRKESTATNATFTSESSSPSSSCEDGQFSGSNTSRSSSVSSLHSDTHSSHKEGDTTPIATPVLPYGNDNNTPRAGDEERDLWALSGDFEDETAREKREYMERSRIDNAKGSPRKELRSSVLHSSSQQDLSEAEASISPKPVRPTANHARRRSTAFELGGAWGAMVGKKWNEMASQISSNETLRNSSKKALGIMEGFEKSLNEAITPDPYEERDNDHQTSNNTQLMLVNGELIPTGDWSPVSSPHLAERRENDKSLPSGIGGPSAWSALLGRTPSRTTPKSPQSQFAWQADQRFDADSQRMAFQPSLSPGGRSGMAKSLLDEENDESHYEDPLRESMTTRTASLSPIPMTAQERIQASRAKHAKRMSMPVNTLKSSSPVEERKTTGLGLLNENEDEDESAWGW